MTLPIWRLLHRLRAASVAWLLGAAILPLAGFAPACFGAGAAPVVASYGGLDGYQDPASGRWLIEPQFSQAWEFDNGLAFVEFKDHGGAALINVRGEIVVANVVPAIWYEGPAMAKPGFSQGLLAARDIETDKVGFLNPAGDWVIKPRFFDAFEFHEGLAAVRLAQNGPIGFIDRRGHVLIAPRFATNFRQPPVFSEGLAAVGRDEAWPRTNLDPPGRLGYIDRQGRWVIAPKYSAGQSFVNGTATVLLGQREVTIRNPLKR